MSNTKSRESYIDFIEGYVKPNRKTRTWTVESKDKSTTLGHIRWYGAWRCYSFFPEPHTVFEHRCLEDIAIFCFNRTTEHKSKKKSEHHSTRELAILGADIGE